ncbi:MAG: hypothetical protein N2749_06220 [Clostridia bacterium]|nr:hypothetical protein [Clostridia bacterium]
MENIKNKISSFNKRFNVIDTDNNEQKFKNLVLNAIVNILNSNIQSNDLETYLLKYMFITNTKSIVVKESRLLPSLSIFGETINPNDSLIYSKIRDESNFSRVIYYLQLLLWSDDSIISNKDKKLLYDNFKEAIELSNVNIRLKCVKDNNSNLQYIFYPSGAKELDNKLVNDVAVWLIKYPKSQQKFISALEKIQNNGDIRNTIDDLRLCLEMFIKQILNNRKTLENNADIILSWLKNKNVHVNIRNMYRELLVQYTCYQNETTKHNEECKYIELEYLLYLTANFIRFIIVLDEAK